MKLKDLETISNLLYFTKESLRQLEKNEDALNFNLKYWLKKGNLVALKKGVYILKNRFEKEQNKDLYLEYLANRLYEPSYLSLEYVMQKHSLLTEGVWGITNITTKKTKTFTNKLAQFNYYSISPDLFTGYEIKKFYSAPVFVAKKSKAVFDYLYLRFLKNMAINEKVIKELRINWENINKTEFGKIQKYSKKAKSIRIKKVIKLIKGIYYA